MESPEVKSQAAKSVVEQIGRIPDPVIRGEYFKKAGEYLGIEEKILRTMIQIKASAKEGEARPLFLNAEKRLLQMLFEDSRIAPAVFKALGDEDFKDLRSEPIFKILSDFFNKGKEPDFQILREKIGRDLFSALSHILQEKEQTPSIAEALSCALSLHQFSLENQSKTLKLEIQRLEKAKETKKVLAAMKSLQEVKMELSKLSAQELQE